MWQCSVMPFLVLGMPFTELAIVLQGGQAVPSSRCNHKQDRGGGLLQECGIPTGEGGEAEETPSGGGHQEAHHPLTGTSGPASRRRKTKHTVRSLSHIIFHKQQTLFIQTQLATHTRGGDTHIHHMKSMNTHTQQRHEQSRIHGGENI